MSLSNKTWALAAQLGFALAALLGRSAAFAAPFENTGMGGAVFSGPLHPHLSSLYINPAALAFAPPGWSFHTNLTLGYSRLSLARKSVDPTGALANLPRESAGAVSPAANMGVLFGLSDNKIHIGLAASVPNSQNFLSGPDSWGYHTRGGHLAQGLLTLGGTYSLSAQSVVFGLSYSLGQWTSMRYRFDTDLALQGGSAGVDQDCGDGSPCGFENPARQRRYDFDLSRLDLRSLRQGALSLGLAVRLASRTWLTASYAESISEPSISGDVRVQEPDGSLLNAKGEIGFQNGSNFYLGFRTSLGNAFDLISFARYRQSAVTNVWDLGTFGPGLKEADVPEFIPRFRGFQSSALFALGIEQLFSSDFRWGTRVRLESESVPKEHASPLVPDGHSATLAGGVELHVSKHWILSGGLDLTYFLPRDVSSSAYSPLEAVACVDSGYNYNSCAALREGRAGATALGDYQQLGGALHFALRYESR